MNLYGYANQNSVMFTDPLGLEATLGDIIRAGARGGASGARAGAGKGGWPIAAAAAIVGAAAEIYKECTKDDPCPQLIARIDTAKNGIARRFRQLSENAGGIDQATHWVQLRGRQNNLRQLLNEAAAKGCQVPSDAWYWASK